MEKSAVHFEQGDLDGSQYRIGVVTGKFNSEITEKLEAGALAALRQHGCTQIDAVRVPGAFEIPLAAKWLLERGCDGVVALGAVIRGETSHYDFVCAAVERGCSELQLQSGRPVAFGVLTTENEEQALARSSTANGHLTDNKGAEAAMVAIEMLRLRHKIGIR